MIHTNKFLVALFLLVAMEGKTQVTIGTLEPPEAFSILQLDETAKGLRLNQFDESLKSNLTRKLQPLGKEATKGLAVYNTDKKKIEYWDGTQWVGAIGAKDIFSSDSYLQSNGSDKFPNWATIKLPMVKRGEYYIHSMDIKYDNVGCMFSKILNEYNTYEKGDVLDVDVDGDVNGGWKIIEGLTVHLNIPEVNHPDEDVVKNKVSILFQTTVQIGTGVVTEVHELIQRNGSAQVPLVKVPYVSFAIGFFVGNGDNNDDYGLELVRVEKIESRGDVMAVNIYNVEGTLENLPSGPQTIKVAVRRRTQGSMEHLEGAADLVKRSISVGAPLPNAPNLNSFLAQSFLTVETYVLDW